MPFRLELENDRLVCKVSWEVAGDRAEKPSKQDIIDLIQHKGIKEVETSTIDKAYSIFIEKGKLKDFVLKKGNIPSPPKDGIVKWLFDSASGKIHAGKVETKGTIDYRERRNFVEVNKEQLLGTWTPPVPGKPGEDVFGEPIQPLNPKKNQIIPGKNVRLSENETKCFSNIMGHVLTVGFRVSVDKMYRLEGDVDFKTGNIHFPGNIQIDGNVKEKFIVEAKGDIMIEGMVENAEVRATGNIIVNKGITRNSKVISENDLEVEFIQDSYVECGGKLTVKKSIVKSMVNADEDIIITELHGSNGIVGGTVNAGYDVSSYGVGTVLGVQTKVSAGRNCKLYLRFKQLLSDVEKAHTNIKRFKYFLELMKTRSDGKITDVEKKKQGKIETAMATQENELAAVMKELDEVKSEADRYISAKVKVFGTTHEGAEISIWETKITVEQTLEKSMFLLDHENNRVISKPLII